MVCQAYGPRPPHRHPAVVHTLHLYPGRAGSSPAQPLCWSEAKNIPAPQTQLCAFTDSHCVAHRNTCTYFSMVSLASTTRSLSVHMSCVLLKSESGNQRAQERAQHVRTELWSLSTCCWDIILKVRVAARVGPLFLYSYHPVVVTWDWWQAVPSPGYEVIYKKVWTFYFKYSNIKKKNSLRAMSPLFKGWLPFKSLCVSAWCDNITASCSV